MSINAVSGIVQTHRENDLPSPVAPSPAVAPFHQQLDDAQSHQNLAAQPHHHHGQTTAATTAPAAATTPGNLAAAFLNLLS